MVSSVETADGVRVDQAQVHALLARPRPRPRRPGRAPRPARCRRTRALATLDATGAQPGGQQRGVAGASAGRSRRSPSGPVVDGVHRRRSRPAAPAPCRCWTSPSPGGCAARGSAARAGTPACPSASTETPTSRPGRWRSSPARTDMKPACGPPKHSGTPNRWTGADRRRRRRSPPAGAAASARAGRWPPRPARRARGPAAIERSVVAHARRSCPGTTAGRRRTARPAAAAVEVGDAHVDAERLGPGAQHARSSAGGRRRRPGTRSPTLRRARRSSVIASAAAVRLVEQAGAGGRQPGQVRRPWSGSSAAPRAGPG